MRAHAPDPPTPDSLSHSIAARLGGGAPRIVWTDAGDEVLVHLDGLDAQARDGMLVVRVELEADDVGRERLTLPFALGEDAGGRLVATAPEVVTGGPLAARWGLIAQDTIFDALAYLRGGRAPQRCAAELDAVVARKGVKS